MTSSSTLSSPAAEPASVLVVGASRGIGLELVRQYRAAGARVVATARDDAGLQALSALGAKALRIDVAKAASVAGLAWQIDGEAFDLVVVNAGVYGPRLRTLDTPSAADFDAVMHTNVLGPMQVLPQLLDALAPGARLVVVSSIMASIGSRSQTLGWLYAASKAALNSVLKDVSLALAGRATCIAVHPGWVQTAMGGPQAPLPVADSAGSLRATFARLTPADNGRFLNLDGSPLDW
ncbi:SDR family oxidoreductase [Sphaerotilus uruguayifluvii]|uniref:NAD(P)-dependent dehydrogenase (Short-subunit alcohol dehydrogenase family) n=1 Tax=Sphaerotilus uruguayifluvii TaxID=2735897 RepID=A0ABX2FXQ8_9BURK|nr:SDR family oxidoreductase [Leptothrix sp. C29]NRT54336.1 NAD(P)-dependent dehydrogenase (short-subunit alcohol dehydrogenase family) [Leptothrix sp. C29]